MVFHGDRLPFRPELLPPLGPVGIFPCDRSYRNDPVEDWLADEKTEHFHCSGIDILRVARERCVRVSNLDTLGQHPRVVGQEC